MISWVAMERIYEREIQRDAKLRNPDGARPLRVHAKHLTDEELLARLRSFGIEIDRGWLERNCARALSARRSPDRCWTRTRAAASKAIGSGSVW